MSTSIFPSQNMWITPRINGGKIDSSNCEILLNQKIDKIDKMLMWAADVKISSIRGSKGEYLRNVFLSELYLDEKYSVSLSTIDVTKYVVEKGMYNTLSFFGALDPIPWGKVKLNNAWYYEHNGNSVVLVNSRENLFAGHTLPNIIQFVLYDIATANNGLYFKSDDVQYIKAKITAQNICDIHSDVINTDLLTMQFRIYYTPLGESVKLQVPKTNPQPNQFCIPYSQQQPIVDNISHGREMQSIANRAGCEKKEVVRTLHKLSDIRNPHDGWGYIEKDANGKPTGNVWRLTATRIEMYSETYIRVLETWSKNWSFRSENVPINREFRSWNIPAEIVQRNLLWQDYCLITRKNNLEWDDTSLLSNLAKTLLVGSLKGFYFGNGPSSECSNMWFYRKNAQGDRYGVVLSCSAFGFGNSLVFSGKTKDNLSAGIQRVDSDDNGKYQFCKDVYYCDDDGKLDSMYIQIGSTLYSDDAEAVYLYPEFIQNDEKTVNMFEEGVAVTLFKGDADYEPIKMFKVRKDPSEQLNFTYQLHLLTDDGFLVIGSTWASSNPLVKQRDKEQTIKVWKLKKYLPQGAQVMTLSYGTELQSNLFRVDDSSENPKIEFNPANSDGTSPNDGVGVCVTDENNNVLIAFNDNKSAIFVVKFTHDYKAIYTALKK